MVSPSAAIGHTRALAKQWRQTVRIETIAGQLSTHGRDDTFFCQMHAIEREQEQAGDASDRISRRRFARQLAALSGRFPLGHSDGGHPIKVGWRKIIREYIRTL